MYVCMYVFIYVCVCVCLFICSFICVCVCLSVCVFEGGFGGVTDEEESVSVKPPADGPGNHEDAKDLSGPSHILPMQHPPVPPK
jgi:hypothetical protein